MGHKKDRYIRYHDMEIPYELIQSSRRTYAIQIESDGSVRVRTPIRMSEAFLEELFRNKENWIKGKYSERQNQLAEAKNEDQYTLEQKRALELRYRAAAKEYIPKRVAYYAEQIHKSYRSISIREQKTRWGSCSSSGSLSFNWKLMLAPPKVLDYVVVHEICHLIHMNHSKAFWEEVERIMPDYEEYKRWLKENGSRLQFR